MTVWPGSTLATLRGATALALLAGPAFAQVTADDLWANQTGYLGSLGFTVDATPLRDGATLTMTDITMTWLIPMGLGKVVLTSGDVVMVENGDGTVGLSYGDAITLSLFADLTIDGETGGIGASFDLRFKDYVTTASGTPDNVTYVTTAGMIDITLGDLTFEGEAREMEDDLSISLFSTIYDMSNTATIRDDGTVWDITNDTTTGQTIYDVQFTDFAGILSQSVGTVATTASAGTARVPKTPIDWMNLSTALRNGLSITANARTADSRTQAVTSIDGDVVSNQSQTTANTAQDLTFAEGGLFTGGMADGLTMEIGVDFGLPPDSSIAIDRIYGSLGFPVLASPAPQEATFAFGFDGLTASDAIWSLADPGNALLRDPVSTEIALKASLVNRVDMFDIMAWEGVVNDASNTGKLPVDLLSLDIETLNAAALGATFGATGAFVFDNADLTTFPGFPRPEGEATATIKGLYAVLDRLTQAGLLPMEMGMGARAGIGMFAIATGQDELTSTFAIGPGGAMTINGAPIPFFP